MYTPWIHKYHIHNIKYKSNRKKAVQSQLQYQKTFPLSLISADAPNKHKTLHFILILIFFLCVSLMCCSAGRRWFSKTGFGICVVYSFIPASLVDYNCLNPKKSSNSFASSGMFYLNEKTSVCTRISFSMALERHQHSWFVRQTKFKFFYVEIDSYFDLIVISHNINWGHHMSN